MEKNVHFSTVSVRSVISPSVKHEKKKCVHKYYEEVENDTTNNLTSRNCQENTT